MPGEINTRQVEVLEPVRDGFGHEKQHEGDTNDWLTPPKLVKALGHFDLDPCSCFGMPWSLADKSYTQSPEMLLAEQRVLAAKRLKDKEAEKQAAEDYKEAEAITSHGLNLPWEGRVFCNPPYGPNVGKWVERMSLHGNGIVLIYARTETKDWKIVWSLGDAFLFLESRIRFYRPDGTQAQSGGAPSTLIAYGANNVEALRTCGLAGAFLGRAQMLEGVKVSTL